MAISNYYIPKLALFKSSSVPQLRFSFERPKEKLAKEKSPAGDKLPEIQNAGGKNCNDDVCSKMFVSSIPAILAFAASLNFLPQFITGGFL